MSGTITGPRRMRLTTWCAVAGYALVASGLPLPWAAAPRVDAAAATRPAKDRSRPFPCMDKPCGCATAEQCFTACCCHTRAETLAWARARGLEHAVREALARRADVRPVASRSGGCCAAVANDAAGCCAAPPGRPAATAAAPAAGPVRTITLRAALACGGILAGWASGAASLVPPAVTAVTIHEPLCAAVAVLDEGPRCTRPVPEPPPPRA